MSCILRICGKKTLNVDTFVSSLHLKPSLVYRKGEYLKNNKIEEPQLIFEVSNADTSNLEKQIKDAIKFLKAHQKDLFKVCEVNTIRTIALDFNFNSRIDKEKVAIQYDYFPSELIKLAGNLNISIWLTQWPHRGSKEYLLLTKGLPQDWQTE